MNKKISAGSCILCVILCCIATFILTAAGARNYYDGKTDEINSKLVFADKLNSIFDILNENGIKVDFDERADAADIFLKSLFSAIDDRYAAYMTKAEMAEYDAQTSGNVVGIGVHVVFDEESGGIYITGVMTGSPALLSGLKAGDIIVRVGEIEVDPSTIDQAINAVRGKAGESVRLSVKRGDEILDFEITRREIDNESVLYEYLGDGTALISISVFDSKTPEQFEKALERAGADGAEGYIFDVRNNPGGNLNAITKILDLLLPEGPIIRITDKKGNIEVISSEEGELVAPMIVLANGNSASAAELFTAALRDYKKALVVGETTFGKGTVQSTRQFNDGTGIRYSTAYYSSPFGDNYDGIGIIPDIESVLTEEKQKNFYKLTHSEDDQLQAAIEALRDFG